MDYSKRSLWSDELGQEDVCFSMDAHESQSGTGSDDESIVESNIPAKYGVLMFFNVFVDVDACLARSGSDVMSKLGLSTQNWKIDFVNAKVVDIVVTGLSHQAGKRHGAMAPNSPCITFALIERRNLKLESKPLPCVPSPKHNGYAASSVFFANLRALNHLLLRLQERRKWGYISLCIDSAIHVAFYKH
jgi:hypothetical protein